MFAQIQVGFMIIRSLTTNHLILQIEQDNEEIEFDKQCNYQI